MPTKGLHYEELYPFFSLIDKLEWCQVKLDLSEEELADYDRVQREFSAWQERLAKEHPRFRDDDDDEGEIHGFQD